MRDSSAAFVEKMEEVALGIVCLQVTHHLVELVFADLSFRVPLPQYLRGVSVVALPAPVSTRVTPAPAPSPPPSPSKPPEEDADDEEDDEEEYQEPEGKEEERVVCVGPCGKTVEERDDEEPR